MKPKHKINVRSIIAHIVFDEKPLSMYIEAARITIDVISAANTPLRPA